VLLVARRVGTEVQFYLFLTSVLEEIGWSSPCLSLCIPWNVPVPIVPVAM
jgi:hypothetical protein